MQNAGRGPGRLHVARVLHGPHHRRHHLGRLHQRTARGLLAGELVDNLRRLADHHLHSEERRLSCRSWNDDRVFMTVFRKIKMIAKILYIVFLLYGAKSKGRNSHEMSSCKY